MKAIIKTITVTLLLLSFQQISAMNTTIVTVDNGVTLYDDSVKTNRPVAFAPYGLVNIFNNDVIICQLAAIGNITREKSSGFQCGGIFNTANAHNGFQLGGIINTAQYSAGVQMAGLINQAQDGRCAQFAGLVNNAHSDTTAGSRLQPVQISGLVNNSDGSAVQIAGIVNNSSSETIFQVAGISNNCNTATGTQIAGIVNRCSYFRGAQIGLINISDSSGGVAVGLINIVKKDGYMKLEISGDELSYVNIGLRSGTRKLHGIVSVGMQPEHINDPIWNVGFGMGTLVPVTGRTSLNIDAMHYQLFYGHSYGESYVSRLNVGLDHMLSESVSLYWGLTFNLLYGGNGDVSYQETYGSVEPYHFGELRMFDNDIKPWVGLKIGLRLF